MIITNPDWFQFIINILCAILFSVIGYKINTLTTEIKNLKNRVDFLQDYINCLLHQGKNH